MSYKKWNTALVNHYFENNDNEEIILYCDEELITEIGSKNNIGDISDFIKSTMSEDRRAIYESFFGPIKHSETVAINKQLKAAKGLKFATFLNKVKIKKVILPFLNFIILSILKKSIDGKSDYFNLLNSLQNPRDYDDLFEQIEKFDNRFINRPIGKLRYESLIRFQVVLSKKELQDLERILYTRQLEFNEDESYETILNKGCIIEYSSGKLREKLISSLNDECYKIWFENKIKNFRLENYSFKDAINENEIKIKGEFALCFKYSEEFTGLFLINNANLSVAVENDEFLISSNSFSQKMENDFFSIPVKFKLPSKIEIKEYKFENDNIEINSIKVRDIIFLQEINNIYIQTEFPETKKNTYILVNVKSYEYINISAWIIDSTNEPIEIALDKTKKYFGDNYKLIITNNVKCAYYNIDKSKNHRVDSRFDYIRKFGGLKYPQKNNTYLDVALPQFKINITNFSSDKLKIELFFSDLNVSASKIITSEISKNIISLFFDNDYQFDRRLLKVKFTYDSMPVFVKEESFVVVSSKIKEIREEKLCKYNSWGIQDDSSVKYFNNMRLVGSEKIVINNYSHNIGELTRDFNPYNDLFINSLASIFDKIDNSVISKNDNQLKSIYANSISFLTSRLKIALAEDDYSYSNLLRNLIELGYISIKTETIDGRIRVLIQPLPTTFTKIERSFYPGGPQIYKLSGLRTRKFMAFLIKVCNDSNVKIKYKSFISKTVDTKMSTGVSAMDYETEETTIEYALLPDLVFVDHDFPFDKFKQECIDNNIFDGIENSFIIENEHHVGSSLLNFTSKISDFEKEFLKNGDNEFIELQSNINESDLVVISEVDFPRIRKLKTKEIYNSEIQYLEIKPGNYVKKDIKGRYFNREWLNVYVKFIKKSPIIIYKRRREQGESFNYESKIYLYKFEILPSIIKRTLNIFNHGLPSEEKLFIVNSNWGGNANEYPFNIFFKYEISHNEDRRKKLSEILTGNTNITENPQVINSIYYKSSITMTLFTLKNLQSVPFSNNRKFIILKDGESIMALINIGNKSKVSSVYVHKENIDSSIFKKIKLEGIIHEMVAIDLGKGKDNTLDINKIISAIIKNENSMLIPLKEFNDNVLEFQIENYKKESITIIDNY